MQVAAHEAKQGQGHGRLAEELLSILDKGKAKLSASKSSKLVPLSNAAKSRTDLGSLLSVSEHGLSPRRKVLLVGPPGTGKTLTASALAGELGIPLFQVRFDALITKFMGETAARLRQIFDAMVDIRGVYFFDEFDAIGSQRGLANDVGEIRCVLNSFLQMIEQDESNSVIVAATNHPEILDYALFRRFDDVIEYQLPTTAQAMELLRIRLGSFMAKSFKTAMFDTLLAGLSYAEICRAADEAMKEALMSDKKTVELALLKNALKERHQVRQEMFKTVNT